MLTYPNFNPIAIKLGPIKIYWYGIMYLLGFIGAWLLAVWRYRKSSIWTREQISDAIFYCALCGVIGGRIGYTLFYNLHGFTSDPLIIFRTWEGGMSIHGGIIGGIVGIALYARKSGKYFWDIADFIVPLLPLGLGLGRFGNFINGELFGRVTNVPWAFVFPYGGSLPRHPSQLYELFFEGVVLFVILWIYSAKPKPRMAVSAMFLIFYGVFRFFVEFFREPDPQMGYIAFGWLTMGQILSALMIVVGGFLLYLAYRKKYSCMRQI
jgi:phosphatidylglycerol:prolipoprotein diacylglycerol transferase